LGCFLSNINLVYGCADQYLQRYKLGVTVLSDSRSTFLALRIALNCFDDVIVMAVL